MAMYAPKSGGNYPPPPKGKHKGVVVDVVDRGKQPNKFKNGQLSPKVSIHFAINAKKEDGKPFVVSKWFTWSMHQKSSLRPFVENILGKAFPTDEAAYRFDLESIIGRGAFVKLVHVPLSDGGVRANVVAADPLVLEDEDGNVTPIAIPTDLATGYVRVKDRDAVTRHDDEGSGEEVPF